MNKYRNVKSTYNGQTYDSKAECHYAMLLDQRLKRKEIKSWNRQLKIDLYGENGSKICRYIIDFVVTNNDSTLTYIEVKGMATASWRIKKKLLDDKIKTTPNISYEIVWV